MKWKMKLCENCKPGVLPQETNARVLSGTTGPMEGDINSWHTTTYILAIAVNTTRAITSNTYLGLTYVRRLLESAGDERQSLLLRTVSRCYSQDDRDFITAALGLDSFTDHNGLYGCYDRGVDSYLDGESRLDLPPGWLWAHKDGYYHGVIDLRAKGLRDWGYVFWDLERLQKAGVLDLE